MLLKASFNQTLCTTASLVLNGATAPYPRATCEVELGASGLRMDPSNATTLSDTLLQSISTMIGDAQSTALSSAAARADEVVAATKSSSWIGLLGRLILAILHLISTILYFALKITTINIPTLLFTLFSTSLTVTMNATTLMLIMALVISAVSWVVRYRYLNMYSRLPPEPQRKEPEIDLFPDTHEEGIKSGLGNYLDEFLSAIKIFGYLERPVFHELTRSMQTRKLIAGETLNLEEEKGFCIVVDGLVEIFVKSARNSRLTPENSQLGGSNYNDSDFSEDEENHAPGQQRYQLLTEVPNGTPMSSLFTIMSLFTEDVKLRHTDDDNSEPNTAIGTRSHPRYPLSADFRKSSHDIPVSFPSTPQLDDSGDRPDPRQYGPTRMPSNGSATLPNIPPMSLDAASPLHPHQSKRPVPKRLATNSAHPDIIARATVDTTIAIIPASAFRRLIRIYPKATAHIVHVILSRFQRVTLATAYNYLGLTGEVLQTERNMIKYTSSQLPNFLRGDPLERLKEKFKRERERIGEDEEGKGIALHNSGAGHRRRSSTLRKEAVLQAISKRRPTSVVTSTIAPPHERSSIDTPGPGDLLANIQISRSGGRSSSNLGIPVTSPPQSNDALHKQTVSPLAEKSFNPFATQTHGRISLDKRETADEDNIFRESILECMFKAIGLTSSGTASRGPDSVEASPRLVSYDQRRQKAVFSNNAFGFMESFDGSTEGDAESMTSGGITMNATPNAHALAHDMKDELEIVFFPKGSVLVEQGERNPGLYYVVDGFLDICITVEESSTNILHTPNQSSFEAMDSTESFPAPRRSATTSSRFSLSELGDSVGEGRKKGKLSRRSVALVKPGGLAGYVGTVSSYRSFIDVVAKTDVYVGFLPRASLERIVDKYPIVLLTMAKRLTNILPRLILHIDFALEWLQVNAGQVIYHEAEESDAIYLVLNGRLRLVEDRKDGGVNVRGEFGQGDSVGELEVLTESARSGTLHAIRDTEVVKFPRTLFNSLAQEHPNITIKISKIIASRMRNLIDDPTLALTAKDAGSRTGINRSSTTLNLRTVAILPVTAGVPVVEFGNRLMNALSQVGTPNGATSLNQSAILNHLGKHAFNKMGKLRLSQYLADLEEKYDLVVYVAGLVLGGGGARGIAQVGIIRAMEEAGIPIDIIGGTSIGAFIGGLYARHADVVPIFGLAKKFSGRMASMWRFALDLTYPSASYTTGHEFNRGIFKTFGKTQIEDFWLEYYCNTTNISKSRAEFHTSGYAWRYVRASMSLAGLLPPLCDEGSMLLDGGYIDNLTVSHMKSLGVDVIFAVDVGSLDDDTPQSFGDSLSGMWAFWNRWNPLSSTPNPPTLAEIQARLAYVSSVDALERAKTMPGCIYMRPPIDEYGTLDFGKFDEITQVGYKYGQEFLQEAREKGLLPLIEETEAKKALRRTMAPRRASI
ncbi:putative lysophospholipase nte1 protein [Phaeoacremonium minimum UCRPA7]|uniref:Lysophospholipase NTE1 n=1 Tax=Phaeoacremonium minimum (strain UCR-PA7) TaxID=1286976 RepID=R8BBB9_PHAM7|nr:putative lysophospholipase nte1 protein [Phaeoacremonium minimum UCRPA7]EON96569.1 putative lysophospholipase nte1 protein [Phaeoacremonium minimum UCRPA7]